jgi:hypothetical protein
MRGASSIELWANYEGTLAQRGLELFTRLYEVEREVGELAADERLGIR